MGSAERGAQVTAGADPVVGIIANPYSGKDIRRLVAYGSTMDNLSKVRILQRVLVGLREAGVRHVLYMPDPSALVPAAFDGLRPADREGLQLSPVLDQIRGEPAETVRAAAAMAAAGAGAIVTLGGDGTNRLVASAVGSVPLMALSTGTNNAFPTWVEPTIAGLATGRVAMGATCGPPANREAIGATGEQSAGWNARGATDGLVSGRGAVGQDGGQGADRRAAERTTGLRREKVLRVAVGGRSEIALVDVALLRGDATGAGAIWNPAALRDLVVTQGLPHAIGLSAVAGQVCPLDRAEPGGVHIRFGQIRAPEAPGRSVRAPIAPGRFETLSVVEARRVDFGTALQLGPGPGVIAVDGERFLTVPPGLRPVVRVEPDGPVVIDPVAVLAP